MENTPGETRKRAGTFDETDKRPRTFNETRKRAGTFNKTGKRAGTFSEVLARAEAGHSLTRQELLVLLEARGEKELQALFRAADRRRHLTMGDAVHLRGIIEFSNYCRQNCFYCGLRAGNGKLRRYRLQPEEIVAVAKEAIALGYGTLVLQSGEDPYYTADMLCRVIQGIRRLNPEVAITLSVGERSYADYRQFRAAGADRYLLKHETSDPQLFARLRPGTSLEARLERLAWLRELGYQVGSGNMVGLPGQTWESLADDLLLLQELDVEMAGIGPFIPHPDTPLAGTRGGTLEDTLKVLACARLLLPFAHLPATTATGTIHPRGRQLALQAGANVVMPNVTPAEYRPHYTIYPNKICIAEAASHCRLCVEGMIASLGRVVAKGPGHSPKPAFSVTNSGKE